MGNMKEMCKQYLTHMWLSQEMKATPYLVNKNVFFGGYSKMI